MLYVLTLHRNVVMLAWFELSQNACFHDAKITAKDYSGVTANTSISNMHSNA